MSVSETFNINCECEQWTSECKLCQAMGFPSGSAVKNLPAWDKCTGLVHWETQRGRMEREVGGGTGMGNTCKYMADSYQCMTKTTQYCEVISLQLIKKKKKKRIYLQCRRHEFNPWVGKIPWKRDRQPIPVFLPRKPQGQRSLADYSPKGQKRSDMTEGLKKCGEITT